MAYTTAASARNWGAGVVLTTAALGFPVTAALMGVAAAGGIIWICHRQSKAIEQALAEAERERRARPMRPTDLHDSRPP